MGILLTVHFRGFQRLEKESSFVTLWWVIIWYFTFERTEDQHLTRMHSSMMRTARLLPISPSMNCSQGGLPAGGCTCWGVYLLGVVPARGCTCWGCTCPGTPHPPSEQNSWHTLLKILPCPNFVAGGNNNNPHKPASGILPFLDISSSCLIKQANCNADEPILCRLWSIQKGKEWSSQNLLLIGLSSALQINAWNESPLYWKS